MMGFKKKTNSEAILGYFKEKSKKKKLKKEEINNHKQSIEDANRNLLRAQARKEKKLRRKKTISEIKPHVHRNNIVKNQLISKFKASKPKSVLQSSVQKEKSKRKKPVKLSERQKIDKTARLIHKSVIYDPRDLSREFAKLGDNPELINKVITERTKKTIDKLRANRSSVSTGFDRMKLYTDLSIIELAIQRGFRPKFLRIDKELEKNVAHDNYISLTECLHEIAFYYGKQKKFKEIDKIDRVDLKDIDGYVLAKLRNPLQHIDEVCEKIEPEKSNEVVMELERKFNGRSS